MNTTVQSRKREPKQEAMNFPGNLKLSKYPCKSEITRYSRVMDSNKTT